jgi:hypothetical protein
MGGWFRVDRSSLGLAQLDRLIVEASFDLRLDDVRGRQHEMAWMC